MSFLSRTASMNIMVMWLLSRMTLEFLSEPFHNRLPYATSPLSVCPVCLSVTLVCCGQTVGRIKMKLGMLVGLGHIVLGGDAATPPPKGAQHPPQF